MDISVSLIIDIVLASTIVALFVAVIVVYVSSARRCDEKLLTLKNQLIESKNEDIRRLEEQLAMVSKGSLGVGRRLMNAEKRLSQTMERQHEMENRDTEQLSFNQAAKLLEKGIELNDVVGKVGITRSEAQLVDLFQQKELETLSE